MAEDNEVFGSRNQPENDSLNSLRDYSTRLGKSATALQEAAKSFNQGATALNKASDKYKSTSEDLLRTLKEINRKLGGTNSGSSGSDSRKGPNGKTPEEEQKENFEEANEELSKTFNKEWTKRDEFLKAAGKSALQVFNYAIDKFKQGFNSVVANFNANYSSITARMQQSNAEYVRMLNGFTDWVAGHDLKTQFSQIDLSNELNTVIATGIRGGMAETMSEYNVITKKLLPAINTNTRMYTRMSKDLGDSFSKAVVEVGKYTEAVYGGMGLEEGGFENLIQTLGDQIMAAGRELGMSKEETTAIFKDYYEQYAKISNLAGVEAGEEFIKVISDMLSGNTSNLVAMQMLQVGGTQYGDAKSLALAQGGAAGLLDKMIEVYSQAADSQQAMIFGNEGGYGGFDWRTALQLQNYAAGYSNPMVELTELEKDQARKDTNYQNLMTKLAQGYFQSITGQQTKWNENATADAATFLASTIPDTNSILNGIGNIVSTFFYAWLASRGSQELSSAVGGNGSLMSMFRRGGSAGGGASGAGAAAGGVPGWVGALGFVTAGALQTKDFIQTMSRGGNFGDALLSTATGYYSGSDRDNLAQALAGNEEAFSFNWGSALSNTGKGAALGVGMGTSIGGPYGLIIGTAIGAASGFVSNTIQQLVSNQQFKEIASNIKSLNEASKELIESQEAVSYSLDNFKLKNEKGESLTATEDLELRSRLRDSNAAASSYLSGGESGGGLLQGYMQTLVARGSTLDRGAYAANLAKSLVESGQLDIGAFDDTPEGQQKLYSRLKELTGFTDNYVLEGVASHLRGSKRYVESLESSGLKGSYKDYFDSINYKTQESDVDLYNKYIQSGLVPKLMDELYNLLVNQASSYITAKTALGEGSPDVISTLEVLKETSNRIGNVRNSLILPLNLSEDSKYLKSFNEYANDYNKSIGENETIRKALGGQVPQFKTGTGRVPSNTLAYLHKDEMVLPSSSAEALRDIVGSSSIGDIAGYINGSGRVTAVTVSPDFVNLIDSAIQAQTRELSSVLERIYNVVATIAPDTKDIRDNLVNGTVGVPDYMTRYEV